MGIQVRFLFLGELLKAPVLVHAQCTTRKTIGIVHIPRQFGDKYTKESIYRLIRIRFSAGADHSVNELTAARFSLGIPPNEQTLGHE